MLRLGAKGHTAANLIREGEGVLNLPSSAMAAAVDQLARLTGSDPVPPHKQAMGYGHCKDKFGAAGLTARVLECPVQMEAVLEATHNFGRRPDRETTAYAFEVRVVRVYAEEAVLMSGGVAGAEDRIDPDAWRPLIMSFCQMYGLGGRAGISRLAEIPERLYRPAAAMGR